MADDKMLHQMGEEFQSVQAKIDHLDAMIKRHRETKHLLDGLSPHEQARGS
jgi:hypothetical protein